MDISENPFVKGTDYFKEYNENVQKLKNQPQAIELDKLCYEVLETPAGKKLIEMLKERFLIPALANPGTPTYQLDVIFADGLKAGYRILINCVTAHAQRIKAETNPA